MTAVEYQKTVSHPKTKYHNKKTLIDGMICDSRKEADHYCELKIQKRTGEIIDFFQQVPLLVNEGYYNNGEWVQPVYYKADFVVIQYGYNFDVGDTNKPIKYVKTEIHEVKGYWTKEAKVKWKIVVNRYPEYKFLVI